MRGPEKGYVREGGELNSIRHGVFEDCHSLWYIDLPEGLETIKESVFARSGLEEITLSSALKEVKWEVFKGCESLKTVYAQEGCEAELLHARVLDSAVVGPPPEIFVRGINVWNLRKQKDIVFPEGIQRIGNHWFYGAGVERVEISASVREIGTDAFCYCRQLKRVTFAKDSRLEKLGVGCFSHCGLNKILIPKSVKELKKTFSRTAGG